jgi:hypothetical protein
MDRGLVTPSMSREHFVESALVTATSNNKAAMLTSRIACKQ